MAFAPPFNRTFSPTFDRRNATGGAWWNLFGAIPNANVAAAYQPKGAADYAASKVNLVTPGTNNSADGAAYPTWNVSTGWTFDGATQYLTTGVVPLMNQTWSMIIRYSGGTNGAFVTAAGASPASGRGLIIAFSTSVDNNRQYYNGGQQSLGTFPTSGVSAIAGNDAFLNGTEETEDIAANNGTNTRDIYIGCLNNVGTAAFFMSVNILAIAIYNNDQYANMAALYTAIAAL